MNRASALIIATMIAIVHFPAFSVSPARAGDQPVSESAQPAKVDLAALAGEGRWLELAAAAP
jgi:hypothetical protein